MWTERLFYMLEEMNKPCIHVYTKVGSYLCPYCGLPAHDYDWATQVTEHIEWFKNNPDHEYEIWSI